MKHSSIRFCAAMRRRVPRRERVLLCNTSTQLKVGCENMVAEARGKFVLHKQYGIYVPILHFKNWVDGLCRVTNHMHVSSSSARNLPLSASQLWF